jgi:alpha-L-fucosidase
MVVVPNYLSDYAEQYKTNPREANRQWFDNAGLGLFLHYGLYSIIGRHEWVQLREQIPVAEYGKYINEFTATGFDPVKIAEFASNCGMKYINITTRHHDSFCLWDTEYSDFNSMNSPAKRDLIQEMVDACEDRGIGLFLYYSHGRDWHHPHAPNNDNWGGQARPIYDPPEPSYAYGNDHDLNLYLEFMTNQITELIEKYPTAAGIWLDGLAVPVSGDHTLFRCDELYDHIRDISPHMLISYKQGLLGTEDFFTPEHYVPSSNDNIQRQGKITELPDKKVELNTTMIIDPISWGYQPNGIHRSAENVMELAREAHAVNANLLINIGPLPDGSLDPIDVDILTNVGKRMEITNR